MKDPKNEFYWRFDRRRLSAEEIRDTVLQASGQLDPIPPAHTRSAARQLCLHATQSLCCRCGQVLTNNRSVYLLQQRFRPNPYLDLFDGADSNNATPARRQAIQRFRLCI